MSAIWTAWQERLQAVAKAEGKPDPLPIYGADGHAGTETQDAVIAYQRSHPPLAVTGQLDAPTRAALNPAAAPHMSSLEVSILMAGLSHLPFLPQPIKDFLMWPTIVQMVIAIVPGIPDDISKVRAEIEELASTDSGAAKLRSFIAFSRAMLNQAEEVMNKVDPAGAVVASTPIPPAVAALAPPKA